MKSIPVSNAAYISVSSLAAGPLALVINQTGYMAPLEKQFSFEVESRRLTGRELKFSTIRYLCDTLTLVDVFTLTTQ